MHQFQPTRRRRPRLFKKEQTVLQDRCPSVFQLKGVVRGPSGRGIDAQRDRKRLGASRRQGKVGTVYLQSLSLAYVPELSPWDSQPESDFKSCSFRDTPSGGQQSRALSNG